MIFKANESKNLTINNRSINGLRLNVVVYPTGTDSIIEPAWGKLNIKAVLKRRGKTIQIMGDKSWPLILATNFDNATTDGSGGVMDRNEVDHSVFLASINFPDIINISKDDNLEVEISVLDGFFATNDLSMCYLEVRPIDAIGLEFATPIIETKVISPGESSFNHSCGSNVKKVTFIHTSTTFDSDIIQNVTLITDKVKYTMNHRDLLSDRSRKYTGKNYDISNVNGESFVLLEAPKGVPLNNVNIEFQLDPENVITGQCYIVVEKYITDSEQFRKSYNKQLEHQRENVNSMMI